MGCWRSRSPRIVLPAPMADHRHGRLRFCPHLLVSVGTPRGTAQPADNGRAVHGRRAGRPPSDGARRSRRIDVVRAAGLIQQRPGGRSRRLARPGDAIWPLVPLALGEAVRARRELTAEHAARAAAAKADEQREAARLVDAERMRIAGEFHDVIAHTMAAVNVQMAVANAAFDQRPETARAALEVARSSCRDAMRELRSSVALLRDPEPLTVPALAADRLEALAVTARAAGIEVTIHLQAVLRNASAATQSTAYRVVQEALTNVVQHSDARRAIVSLASSGPELIVEVADDGDCHTPGLAGEPGRAGQSTGLGLIGMSERVRAVGGQVGYGPRRPRGFGVTAVLPSSQSSNPSVPSCPSDPGDDDPGRHRRRPVSRPSGISCTARADGRPDGGRGGVQRPRGGRDRKNGPAGRAADGHQDARGRWGTSDPLDLRRPGATGSPGTGAHHLRHRPLCLRRAVRRCQRFSAQGHRAGRSLCRHPRHRRRQRCVGARRLPAGD